MQPLQTFLIWVDDTWEATVKIREWIGAILAALLVVAGFVFFWVVVL